MGFVKERREKCRTCEIHSEFGKKDDKVKLKSMCVKKRGGCGCFVFVKSKMRNMYCPQGKWENGVKPEEK